MIRADFHVHTLYDDGENTPEEMVQEAIRKGMTDIGFSGHSYTAFDESWCMSEENTRLYRAEIAALKERYRDSIRVWCGTERDAESGESNPSGMPYDYVIGSVHYLKIGMDYLPVDESADMLRHAVKEYFEGDWYGLTDAYYRAEAEVVEKTHCDLIGHFDLITKFNEGNALFDESHPRYVAAWQKAADCLLSYQLPFEINLGAVSRGYRSMPYPARPIIDYLASHGGTLVLSGDCHKKENLMLGFSEWEGEFQRAGIPIKDFTIS